MSAVLHYIYDPLCGWCYGAEPLAWAASAVPDLEVELHAGALWPEPTRLPQQTRLYIRQADQKIAQLSGQKFGDAYHNGLLLDPSMVLYSRPTIAAVLAARSLDPARGLAMLKAIQHAHYEQARRVVEEPVLCDIAEECGFDRAAFEAALHAVPVDAHIAESRRLMEHVGAQGFPTFLLQIGDDWYPVPHSRFASSPPQFRGWLESQIKEHAPAH
jgi:putative protein-disulfide isomerase